MQFIKTNWIILVSGVVMIGSLVVAWMGTSSDVVVKEMQQEASRIGASNIRRLSSDPKNEESIRAAEEAVKRFQEEYKKTFEIANSINKREPLMAGVFPKPARSSTPLKFIEGYRAKLEALPRRMDADTLPTPEEIADEEQNVLDLLALEAEQKEEETIDEQGRQPELAVGPRGGGLVPGGLSPRGGFSPRGGLSPRGGMAPGGGLSPRGGMAPGGGLSPGGGLAPAGGRFSARGGLAPGGRSASPNLRAASGEPKYDPVYRARVNKALSLRCYVEPFETGTRLSPTFHISPIIQSSSAPSPEDMWYAQVSLWVQQDVADAIARLNNEAARKVKDASICVEQMPVKRLKLVRVGGYDLASGPIEFPSLGVSGPRTGEVTDTFTKRTSNDLYDVVHFRIVAVVDQRFIPELVNAISTTNYYVNTSMSLAAVDRNQDQNVEGYFYGTAPVVQVTLDFEGYLLREAYQELMPPAVRKLLGIKTGDG